MSTKIRSFTDLVAWQKAHLLAVSIHNASGKYPDSELFGLTSQIRRAGLSVSSNIAEGFSRHTSKDKTHFYYIALASLTELQNQLMFSRDVGYLLQKDYDELYDKTIDVHKLIRGMIKGLNKHESDS